MRPHPRRRTTIGIVLAPLLLLTACSGSSEKDVEDVREAIVANAPGVEDAMVRYRTDVLANDLDIRLSMPTTSEEDDAALLAAIDVALDQAWNTSPSAPSNINLDVVVAPLVDGDRIGDSRAIAMTDRGIDVALGLENGTNRSSVAVPSDVLAERYGQRSDT